MSDKKGGGAHRTAACLIAVHLLQQQLQTRGVNPDYVDKCEDSIRVLAANDVALKIFTLCTDSWLLAHTVCAASVVMCP